MPPRAEEERIQRSHDPGGAFFVRLNSFAFSFRYIIKKNAADAWSVCRKLPKNHWLKENAWCKSCFRVVCLFVCCCRPMGDINSIQKVLLQKKNLSSLPKKRRPIDFVLVKPQKDSKKKVSLGGVVQNQIKALVSFCTTFSFVGEKSPHFLNTKKSRDDDSTAKDRLRMGARGDDRRRQRVFYIQRTAARVSRREESRGGGRARGEREEAIGKIERCIVV